MALSPYQAPPFRTMDDAQHIPTSAQHGAKHTMANVALTQQMSVSDTTTVAGKFRALYMAMVQSKPSNDSTHTPPSSNRGHKLLLHAYTLIFSAPRGIHKQFTARSSCITRDRQSTFPHITASHGDLLAPYRCNKLFGQALTPIFSAPRADYTTMYNENLAYNQGIESNFPHITAPLGE